MSGLRSRLQRRIGARIALARTEAGLTQQSLARVIGVTQGAVSFWEAGQTMPTDENLRAIARALNTTFDDFLTT